MEGTLTKFFFLLAVSLLSSVVARDVVAQTGSLTKDPSEVVKKYLTLDLRGARLDSLSREAQEPYVAWKEEPVWGHAVVIEGFQVIEDLTQWQVNGNLDVIIPVEFQVVGSLYWERATFLPDRHVERIGFHVKEVRGMWRIVGPMLPPHVGRKRMVNYVRQAMLEESDPSRTATLAVLRDELRNAK